MESQKYDGSYHARIGGISVEVWRSSRPEEVEIRVTLPSGEVVWCVYKNGNVESRLLDTDRANERDTRDGLTMVHVPPLPLSDGVRDVAMKAVNEFLNQE